MSVFVDTNVLAYAHDATDTRRQDIARTRLEDLWQTGSGVISTQVLAEFYNVATRKFDPPMVQKRVREIVAAYEEWRPIQVDALLIVTASLLEEKHSLSFWDALIVEAARRAGAEMILTEDLQHDRRFGTTRVVNPFR